MFIELFESLGLFVFIAFVEFLEIEPNKPKEPIELNKPFKTSSS